MTSTDVDKVYVEKIKPRLVEGTPTESIRRWSVSAHSVMEVTGPSPFGMDGNVLLWLHENSLTQLLDMCDAVDKKFSEVEQAAALGNGTCEMVTSGTPCEGNTDVACTCCGAYNIGEYYDGCGHRVAPKFCPECGRKVLP